MCAHQDGPTNAFGLQRSLVGRQAALGPIARIRIAMTDSYQVTLFGLLIRSLNFRRPEFRTAPFLAESFCL